MKKGAKEKAGNPKMLETEPGIQESDMAEGGEN